VTVLLAVVSGEATALVADKVIKLDDVPINEGLFVFTEMTRVEFVIVIPNVVRSVEVAADSEYVTPQKPVMLYSVEILSSKALKVKVVAAIVNEPAVGGEGCDQPPKGKWMSAIV
jgi:hypothetical protein